MQERTLAMRFPQENIRQFVLHSDPNFRRRVVWYFVDSSLPDPTIMPLVIQALEMFGRKETDDLIQLSPRLAQTEETAEWAIRELNRDPARSEWGSESGWDVDYYRALSQILANLPPALLLPRKDTILACPQLNSETRDWLDEWLPMLSWDAGTCWRELEAFCALANKQEDPEEIDFDRGDMLADAAALHAAELEPKVRAVLMGPDADRPEQPFDYLRSLSINVAGRAGIESTIPYLVATLERDDDDIGPIRATALSQIGTPAVVHELAARYADGSPKFRWSAVNSVGSIYSDLVVEQVMQWLALTRDPHERLNLVQALLWQFASEGVPPARELLRATPVDLEETLLRRSLVETCAMTGERFPEYDDMAATVKAEDEERRRLIAAQAERAYADLASALEEGQEAPAEFPGYQEPPKLHPYVHAEEKRVGRNDPCPCGSGKKFKKCCMGKKK
jgi:hypothetical protein